MSRMSRGATRCTCARFLAREAGGRCLARVARSRGGHAAAVICLFYRTGTDLMAVTVRTTPTFATGQRASLFSVSAYQVNPNHAAYDVLPDDRGFVFVRNVGGTQSVIMVLNWFPELERVGTQ